MVDRPRSRARRLLDELEWTPENMLVIAQAFLDDADEGDVPAMVCYEFATELPQAESEKVTAEIHAMREAHFAALGKPVPVDDGPPLR